VNDCTFARETGEVEVAKTGKPSPARGRAAPSRRRWDRPRRRWQSRATPGRAGGSVETLHHPPNPAAAPARWRESPDPKPRRAGGRESGGGCESVGRGFESLCGLHLANATVITVTESTVTGAITVTAPAPRLTDCGGGGDATVAETVTVAEITVTTVTIAKSQRRGGRNTVAAVEISVNSIVW